MRKSLSSLLQHKRAVSYTVSAIIITATTISLVLVASLYAYQVLEQQRGATEFDVAKESLLAFNDALENVAWKTGAVHSSRFTVEYGYLQVIPNGTQDSRSVTINATVGGNTTALLPEMKTGFLQYFLSNRYISFGEGYSSYILRDSSTVNDGSAGGYGRAVIKQQSGWVTITLDYQVRAMKTSVINVTIGATETPVNYVDIWIIRLVTAGTISSPWSYIHDFDLKARCLSVQTTSYEWPYQVQSGNATISVQIDDATNSVNVPLVAGNVVFNLIVSEVQVSV